MKKILSILLFAWLTIAAQAGNLYRYASDYCEGRDSVCLTNLIAELSTNYHTLVIDGGFWSISNGVVIPVNIELLFANDSGFTYSGTNTVVVQTRRKQNIWMSNAFVAVDAYVSNRVYAGTAHIAGGVTASQYRIHGNSYGTSTFATAIGGTNNIATGEWSVVVGGVANWAYDEAAVVVGGTTNRAGLKAFVGGGMNNKADGAGSVILGGYSNEASGGLSIVLGGWTNIAAGAESVVGGVGSKALGFASVAFGSQNYSTGSYSLVAGGSTNVAGGEASVVVAGYGNIADGPRAFIGAGGMNVNHGTNSTILNGDANTIHDYSYYSSIMNGSGGFIHGSYATIIGGVDHYITNSEVALIANGSYNTINGGTHLSIIGANLSTIQGGASRAAILAGSINTIAGTVRGSTILAGDNSTITTSSVSTVVDGAVILGGGTNTASASYAMVGGIRAKGTNQSVLVWSDNQASDFGSISSNRVMLRASGNLHIAPNGDGSTNTWAYGGYRFITNSTPSTLTAPWQGASVIDIGSNYMWIAVQAGVSTNWRLSTALGTVAPPP